MNPIDMRSDTVTRPTKAMFEAMFRAELGDDTLGDEPTVQQLEARVAEITGKEAALFVPSGTMANLLAMRSQTQPGDAVIAHEGSHFYHYESGGYAAIAGCNPRFVSTPRGIFSPDDAARHIPWDDPHFSQPTLVWIENTMNRGGGAVWPLYKIEALRAFTRERGYRLHMDGARIWNAATALGVPVAKITEQVDSVSCCFSKGLGCPVGSALASDAETIARARRHRKMCGGSMRQSGLLAAAALHALDHHRERLADDHASAKRLAALINEVPGLSCDTSTIETNMAYFSIDPKLGSASEFCKALDAQGVRVLDENPTLIRAVCHLDVSREQVERAGTIIKSVAGSMA